MSREKNGPYAWFVWIIMVLTYMFNTFHAVSMGVIRQDIIEEFGLTENAFIFLTNMFSYLYMIMQIPVGIFLDRFGPKGVSIVGNLLAAVGVFLFAFGQGYPVLLLGRGLIGMGCSVCFLSVLKICAGWFSEKIFCTMSGVTGFVGMAGAMFAQAPLAALCEILSWRNVFLAVGVITIAVVLLIFIFVQDTPDSAGYMRSIASELESDTERKTISVLHAAVEVIKNKATWPPLIAYGCFYGSYLLISGYYGTSMLESFYGCSPVQASSCIFAAVLGCAVGNAAVSAVSDKLQNRRMTQFSCGILFCVSWLLLMGLIGNVQISFMYPVMFLLGLSSCGYAVCWSCVKECNSPDFVGISTSVANMGGYLGTIVVPTVVGIVYSRSSAAAGELAAYKSIILAAFAVSIVGIFAAWLVKETKGKNIWQQKQKI